MDPIALLAGAMRLYVLVIIVRAVFSWLPPQHRASQFYRLVHALTEPALRPIRQLLPASRMDFSPLVAIVLLEVIAGLLRA